MIEYYNKWLIKYPTVESLAKSSLDDVNEIWAGLGYYRRAKYLHDGAKKLHSEHQNQFPNNAKDLQKLPGIGKYTAGAIASIVFHEPVPVVDGNVIRVLARLRMIDENPKTTKIQKLFWELAEKIVDPERPGCFNQALMELGALICTNANPTCKSCPISAVCQAYQNSIQEKSTVRVTDFPVKVKKQAPRQESVVVCIVCALENKQSKFFLKNIKSAGKFLIIQRPTTGLLASMWEFPSCAVENNENETQRQLLIKEYLKSNFGIKEEGIGKYQSISSPITHLFSHIRQTILVDYCFVTESKEKNKKLTSKWVDWENLQSSALSKGMKKALEAWESSLNSPSSISKFFKNKDNQ